MKVTLFSKPGCHLCEAALADLKRFRDRYPHALHVVDITSDPALLAHYGLTIPVLRVGEREFAAPLTPQVLEQALRNVEAN